MKRPATTLFLASMVFASAAFAGTDINKCVTSSGQVTLTDEVCPKGAQVVKVISVPSDTEQAPAPQATERAPALEQAFVPRMASRYAAPPRFTPPSRGLSLDVVTLKMARANMHLVESATQMAKSQRLAGLQ
jgi:hypothetical protein